MPKERKTGNEINRTYIHINFCLKDQDPLNFIGYLISSSGCSCKEDNFPFEYPASVRSTVMNISLKLWDHFTVEAIKNCLYIFLSDVV